MPQETGPAEQGSTATGSSQCPWCWAVWNWAFPTDANYTNDNLGHTCPRCGLVISTMPASVQQIDRGQDLEGYPSE